MKPRSASRLLLLVLFLVFTGAAQDSTADPGITRKQADDILNELRGTIVMGALPFSTFETMFKEAEKTR